MFARVCVCGGGRLIYLVYEEVCVSRGDFRAAERGALEADVLDDFPGSDDLLRLLGAGGRVPEDGAGRAVLERLRGLAPAITSNEVTTSQSVLVGHDIFSSGC